MAKNIDLTLLVSLMTDAQEMTLDRGEMIEYQNTRVTAREYDGLVDRVEKLLDNRRKRLVNLQAFYDALPDTISISARDALAVGIEEVKATIADLEKVISGE